MDKLKFDKLEGMVDNLIKAAAAKYPDDEELHIEQDYIYELTLEAIMNGVDNPTAWAACALRIRDVDFSRWYA